MINKHRNPVEWAQLMYELTDAQEHLDSLIEQLNSNDDYGGIEFKIDIGHIYSHLNRAANSREHIGEIDEKTWQDYSEYPLKIKPLYKKYEK